MIRTTFFLLFIFFAHNTHAGTNFGALSENCKVAVHFSEAGDDSPLKKDLHAAMQAEKCWTYLKAFQEALAWSAIKQASRTSPEPEMDQILRHLPFCIPDSVTLKQQALIIINHADRNPTHSKWPAGAVFGEIMLGQYPCKASSSQ